MKIIISRLKKMIEMDYHSENRKNKLSYEARHAILLIMVLIIARIA